MIASIAEQEIPKNISPKELIRSIIEERSTAFRYGIIPFTVGKYAPKNPSIEIDLAGNEVILNSSEEWSQWFSDQVKTITSQDLRVWSKTLDYKESRSENRLVAMQLYDLTVVRGTKRTTYTIQSTFTFSLTNGISLLQIQSALLNFRDVLLN